MIDTAALITDAQLLAAFNAAPVKPIEMSELRSGFAKRLRHVAELAIATWISATFSSDPRRVVAAGDGMIFCADGTIWIRALTGPSERRWVQIEGLPRP